MAGEKGEMLITKEDKPEAQKAEPRGKLMSHSKTLGSACEKTERRASITPGSILLNLAGHHRGQRVTFLKELSRVCYLVHEKCAISTPIGTDPSGVKIPKHLTRSCISPNTRKMKPKITGRCEVDQKTRDLKIFPKVKAAAQLQGYLCSVLL
ncbi:60S ribosomal protein L6, partial [Galemys pyrenaicus]